MLGDEPANPEVVACRARGADPPHGRGRLDCGWTLE